MHKSIIMAVGVFLLSSAYSDNLYVANQADRQLVIIDTNNTADLSKKINLNVPPGGLAMGIAGHSFFLTKPGEAKVSLIQSSTLQAKDIEIGVSPSRLTLTPNGRFIYVSDNRANYLSIIDFVWQKPYGQVNIGTSSLAIACSADGKQVYTTSLAANAFFVIDTASNQVIQKISVGKSPRSISVTQDGNYAYVANFLDNSVSVIDLMRYQVVGELSVNYPTDTGLSRDGTKLYVTSKLLGGQPGEVVIFDLATHNKIKTIQVGRGPNAIVLSEDGARAYVANADDGTVSELDLSDDSLSSTFPVGHYPLSLALQTTA